MSYGNYSRYGPSSNSLSGNSRRPGSYYSAQSFSSYVSPSCSRRSTGGSYALMPSLSSSYISPTSSPRSSISSASPRDSRWAYGSYRTQTTDALRSDYSPVYKLSASKSTSCIQDDDVSDSESHGERTRHRYGSSTSIPDTASDTSSRSETPSRFSTISSKSSYAEDNRDYKRLYEELKRDNEKLKESLRKSEEELERTKKQLQKCSQNNSMKNSPSETEKKERRSLERKLSEMEEELKNIAKLKAENEKLKAENRALSRVVCKLSK